MFKRKLSKQFSFNSRLQSIILFYLYKLLLFQGHSLVDVHGTLLYLNCEARMALFAITGLKLYNFPHIHYLPFWFSKFLSSDLCQTEESEH